MVDVSIAGDLIVFQVEGLHKVWALRSRLEIPLAHLLGAEYRPDEVGRWWHGLKVAGTDAPGLFAAGTFYYHGELVFWDVRHVENAIVVSLADESYRKLIVEVVNPQTTVAMINDAIRSRIDPPIA